MTVLVTGGAGYIGSHMVHALVDVGERVVVLDNLATGFDWAIAKGTPLVIGDVGDQPCVAALIAEHPVEAVIHFAASTVVPDSVHDPLGYCHNNTVNSRALIESAIKGGVRHFIFSSTAAVYGNPERVPVREDAATVPTSPYGSSKLMTEIMLRDAGSAHGLRYVILRYFNVAGADPLGRIGQSEQKGYPPRQGLGRSRARPAAKSGCLRHRLPDTGRHLHPRLYSRVRSRARAFRCAGVSARRRRLRHAQLRLRAGVFPCSR
jgi:UDP-glucose 4-epimerase